MAIGLRQAWGILLVRVCLGRGSGVFITELKPYKGANWAIGVTLVFNCVLLARVCLRTIGFCSVADVGAVALIGNVRGSELRVLLKVSYSRASWR